MLPCDLNAGIGLAQLRRLDARQNKRREIWERYQRAFADLPWLEGPADLAAEHIHSYFTYLIRVPDRDRLARYLLDRDIYTTLRFHPLHLNAIYGPPQRLTNAEILNQTGLNLPLHPRLSEADVSRVIDAVLAWGASLGHPSTGHS